MARTNVRPSVRRLGRALAFEQFESRVVLSTNAAFGEASPSDAAWKEGGLISLDADSAVFVSGDFTILPGRMLDSFGAESNLGVGEIHQSYLGSAPATASLGGGQTNWVRANIEIIESPVEKLQHPEGGHIALNHLPGADAARLVATAADFEADRLVRRPSPALQPGVDAVKTGETDGLRGRAVVFEVAQAASRVNNSSEKLTELTEGASFRAPLEAMPVADIRPAAFAEHGEGREGKSAAQVETRSEPAPWVAGYSDAFYIKAAARSDQTFDDAFAAKALLKDGGASSVTQGEAALAARDSALEAWDMDSAAPLVEADSPMLTTRNRRMLALAAVLTLGAAPLGKLIRSRVSDAGAEQRPPRRGSLPCRLF
jgi:hypothetical protein